MIAKIKRKFPAIDMFLMVLHLARRINNIKFLGNSFKGSVIFECLRNDPFFEVFCLLLSHFFSQRNINCYILKDDGCLNHHDGYRRLNGNEVLDVRLDKKDRVKNRFKLFLVTFPMRWILRKRVRYIKYSRLIDRQTLIGLQSSEIEFDTLNRLPKNVDASHKRFFGGRPFDPQNNEHVHYARMSMGNQRINEHVCQAITQRISPSLFITLDGIYSCYGSLVDEFKKEDVPVLVYQPMAIKNRSIRIGPIHSCVNNVSFPWHEFCAKYYGEHYKPVVCSFLDRRINSGKPLSQGNKIISQLKEKKKSYQKVICLFANITWDGAIKERDSIFEGMHDWIIQTLDWAVNRPYLFVLREHPQSVDNFYKYDSTLQLLNELRKDLFGIENLVLIDSLNKTCSYRLVKEVVDLSVVYNGTLGLEIAYMGYPVVFAGDSPYNGKGVGFESNCRKCYFELLDTMSENNLKFQKEKENFKGNAIRAAAYQFYYNKYYVPIMPLKRGINKGFKRYWQPWEIESRRYDPTKFTEWKRTLDRFLFPWTGDAPADTKLSLKRN